MSAVITDLLVLVAGLNERSVETRLQVLRLFAKLKTSSCHYHHHRRRREQQQQQQ